jgi:hypothetical protein
MLYWIKKFLGIFFCKPIENYPKEIHQLLNVERHKRTYMKRIDAIFYVPEINKEYYYYNGKLHDENFQVVYDIPVMRRYHYDSSRSCLEYINEDFNLVKLDLVLFKSTIGGFDNGYPYSTLIYKHSLFSCTTIRYIGFKVNSDLITTYINGSKYKNVLYSFRRGFIFQNKNHSYFLNTIWNELDSLYQIHEYVHDFDNLIEIVTRAIVKEDTLLRTRIYLEYGFTNKEFAIQQ